MTDRNRRRLYPLIHRSHQYRFLALILVYSMIIVVVIGISLFIPDILQMQDQTLSLQVRAIAADKVLSMHSRIWPAVISLICVIGLHSWRIFHRFVGPLYRFRMVFDEIGDGNLTARVHLRDKDYLVDEEASINTMATRLSGKISEIRSAGLGVEAALDQLAGTDGAGRDAEFSELRRNTDILMKSIRYFQIQDDAAPQPENGK
jgi:methyl-accepting chemotaxis protein